MSDADGNLLFYGKPGNETYGNILYPGGIYNRFNTPMPNGSMTEYSTTLQAATAFPKPGSPKQYYVVYLSEENPNNGKNLRYSLIDMNLDQGKGDVSLKHEFVETHLLHGLSVTQSLDKASFWISTIHYRYSISDIDYVIDMEIYRADSNGINLWFTYQDTTRAGYNHMKFSPNGRYLHHRDKVYDFDPELGVITGYRNIGNYQYYSILNDKSEFSADSKVLYTFGPSTSGFCIAQYDLTQANLLDNVHVIEGNGSTTDCSGLIKGGMQLGPDGRIYINVNFTGYLNRIDYPEIIGPGCTYNGTQVVLNNPEFYFDFPIFPTNYLASTTSTAVSDPLSSDRWNLFPNPVLDAFTLTSNLENLGKCQLTILDASGRVLEDIALNTTTYRVDMQAFPPGLYFVRMMSEGQKQMFKVVRL